MALNPRQVLADTEVMAPLPGSIDEYELRARTRRLVARGRTVTDPAHARLAVDLAREHLTQIQRHRRYLLLASPVWLVFGALQILQHQDVIGILTVSLMPASLLIGLPTITHTRTRLRRAIHDNQELLESTGNRDGA